MDILIPQKWTPRQVNQANTKRAEFRRNPNTSGSANLDNMIALEKAVILCPAHTRKFSPKQVRYSVHPDKRMRRVVGRCDVCKEFGLSHLFICEKDAQEERKKVERFNRAREYGKFVTG